MKGKHKKAGFCYILDNGAYSAKIGTTNTKHPEIVPNCIMKVKSERRRPFIGDQINDCRDASGLFYILPFQRGYLVNWDIQKTVWDFIFAKDICPGKLSEIPICITEPMFNFQSNQDAMDEIFFEEYDACGVLRVPGPDLAAYNYSRTHNRCKNMIVIDTGYSFTHIIPYIDGVKYLPGVKRIDIGGKVLTNHLKEIISYRQLHVMDETYVINQVKEDVCYVSENFRSDMIQTSYRDKRNTIIKEYVLPDYSSIKRGYVRPYRSNEGPCADNGLNEDLDNKYDGVEAYDHIISEQQIIIVNNERITIPEILFTPSDIGIQQMGIAEAVFECIKSCPEDASFSLLANIVVCGGNALFPNFQKRLYAEIRAIFDELITIQVTKPKNPVTYAWQGGRLLSNDEYFQSYMISKDEYEEYGHVCARERREPFKISPK